MSSGTEDAEFTQNDKMEIAKALHAVKSVASEADYGKVKAILVGSENEEAVDQAIHGLSKEDEFALMCRFMGTATHLVHLEQRPVIRGGFIVPDFLARFQPRNSIGKKSAAGHGGFRCLVEVKSTKNDEFRIGGKKLRYLRAFADQFGLPLIFAVRFLRFNENALWVMVEDRREKNSLTVKYGDLTEGVRSVLWDDYFFMVCPWIHFQAIYDTAPDAVGTGVHHNLYGEQTEFDIFSHPDYPITGEGVSNNVLRVGGATAFILSAFFEGFSLEAVATEQRGTKTVQVLRPTMPCSVADMLYIFNRLPRDAEGRALLDPSRVLSGADGDSGLIGREMIDRIARDFWGSVLVSISLGVPETNVETWKRFGGKDQNQ